MTKFTPTDQAFPTSAAVGEGIEEWAEPGLFMGRKAHRIFHFDAADVAGLLPEDYDWSDVNVCRVDYQD